jgi:hypothetical protein
MKYPRLPLLLVLSSVYAGTACGQIAFPGTRYTESFNGLHSSGSVPLPGTGAEGLVVEVPGLEGWYAARAGGSSSADMAMYADNGTLTGGRVYSYGATGSLERALGSKGSGTTVPAFGAAVLNTTEETLDGITITYFHEIWSIQGTTGGNGYEDRLSFFHGLSSDTLTVENFLTHPGMVPMASLDAVSPAEVGLTGVADGGNPDRARDGNSALWRREISASISGLDWAPGQLLFLAWRDSDSGGFDAGHGIDNFVLERGAAAGNGGRDGPAVAPKVDGDFSDWARARHMHHDPAKDGRTGNGMDFLTIAGRVSADGLSLYMRPAGAHVIGNSNLRIYLDTDDNPETGTPLLGLGADVMLDFSPQQVDFRFFPMQAVLYPSENILPAGECLAELLPTGLNELDSHPASDQYEMLVPLSVLPGLQPGGRIGVLFRDSIEDFAPDVGEQFHIDVPADIRPRDAFTGLARDDPSDIRIASYNVLRNGPEEAAKAEAFGRQLEATRPDIINYQELYTASATWARQFTSQWVPLQEGQWHAAKNNDCITVSRFPILRSWSVDGNLVVLIDTTGVWGFDSVIVNAHTPAHVQNQLPRISETTNLMMLLRRLRDGSEPFGPAGEFTVFFIGDLNANSPKIELSAARTGKFADPAFSAMDFYPDDYRLPLVDAAPRHTHRQRLFTWRGLESGNTQRLDYIYYQESRLTLRNAYTVNTETMPADFLLANNLTASDSRASDHLLMIADFSPRQVDFAWAAEDAPSPGPFLSEWFGPARQLSPQWFHGDGFGFFHARPGPHGVWLHDDGLGWLFTHAALYPFAFREQGRSWIYLLPGDTGTPAYFDYATGTWRP